MKARVKKKFIDKVESAEKGKEIIRKVRDEFTLSRERFEEIQRAGDFVEEVKEKPASKK